MALSRRQYDAAKPPVDPFTPGASTAGGFTIIEMMIVMMLMGIMLGLGAGVYLGLGDSLQYQTALGQIKTVIRKTRNFSVSGGGPAIVTLDPKTNQLYGSGNLPVGMWHFEDETGAFSRPATLQGGTIVPEGRFGRGVHFASGGWADLGRSPEYDDAEGFMVEAWVRPTQSARGILIQKGSAYKLSLSSEGLLEASLEVSPGSEVTLLAEKDDPIPMGRWTRVGLIYDRFRFQIVRDGRVVASVDETRPLRPDRGSSLTIGGRSVPFHGWIDEARVFRMVPGEAVVLPEGMTIDGEAATSVVYRRGGSLDPEVHKGPVTLRFKIADKVEELNVGVLGMIL